MKNKITGIFLRLGIIILIFSCNDTKSEINNNFISTGLIQKVEPPNWWVGMETKDLQLLVYGNEINSFVPVIDPNKFNKALIKAIKATNTSSIPPTFTASFIP